MKVGELWVNFGIKGTHNAAKDLSKVKTGMTEIKAMSIEAKAAIVGAIYALERMMSSSKARSRAYNRRWPTCS
jgi:hypothetical protein